MNIYLLKDVAVISGHSIYTIKYYLNIGLINEIGRSPDTNIRFFDDSTLERLNKIRELKRNNMSLNTIKKVLDDEVKR